MVVHTILPGGLTNAVADVLGAAGVAHVAHGDGDPVDAASVVAADGEAMALIGPCRSAEVAEVVEATAPTGLPLIAPLATWAGVTRDDEPGCEDAARHRGTVLRILARDTVVAQRIAKDVGGRGQRALVVAGDHEYGRQLDGQLRLAGLPRSDDAELADLVVAAGLAGRPEIERVVGSAPLPVVAFDGIQGADFGRARDVHVALPFPPDAAADGRVRLEPSARRAAELVVEALRAGGVDRRGVLDALRALGPFDAYGDPVDPPVWLWRADAEWQLAPDRAL